jgi:hypothetical protein
MMYQGDFEQLAAAFLSVKATINHVEALAMRTRLMAAVSDVCASSNTRFDPQRFTAACDGAVYSRMPRRRRNPHRARPIGIGNHARV